MNTFFRNFVTFSQVDVRRNMLTRFWLSAIILIFVFPSSSFAQTGGSFINAYLGNDVCSSIDFRSPVYEVDFGAWIPGPDGSSTFVITDQTEQELLFMTPGGMTKPLSRSANFRGFEKPWRIHPFGNSAIVQNKSNDDRFLGDLRKDGYKLSYGLGTSFLHMNSKLGTELDQMLVLFDWVPLQQKDSDEPAFAALAGFLNPEREGGLAIAFVTFRAGEDARIEGTIASKRLLSLDDDQSFRFRYFRFPTLAAVGDTAYILALDKEAKIGELKLHDSEVRWFSDIPNPLKAIATVERDEEMVSKGRGFELMTRSLLNFQSESSIAGIFAGGSGLYAVHKTGMDENLKTVWSLYELSHNTGKALGVYRIPSQAAHLTTISSDDTWAFIEKSRVSPVGSVKAPFWLLEGIKTVAGKNLGRFSTFSTESLMDCPELRPASEPESLWATVASYFKRN